MEEITQLGKYRLIHLLATGGMGEVFLARSEGPAGFSKTVVIKRILRHLATDAQFVDMFLNEARLAAALTHPNIVQIFELGEEGGTWFIAMEYIHGRSLRAIKQKLLEKQQLFSPMLAARVCAQALLGLHYAHGLADDAGQPLNIVHRDISPDNVLVSVNGQVKLVDFGIAKAANAISTTRTGTVKGKYAYMAPEQLTGGKVDGRTDVYSMGVLLYELLTGGRPYTANTEPALINTILSTTPPPPVERNPNLPRPMSDLILKAMEKDPAARFASAEEMAFALEDFIFSTGQALTGSHIGAFIKDLFGDDLKAPLAGMLTPRPGTNPGGRTSQVGTGPGSRPAAAPAAPLPPGANPESQGMAPTEVVPTPISQAARKLVPAHAAGAQPPAAVETSVVPPKPAGGGALRRGLISAGLGFVVMGAAAGAYVAGKSQAEPEADPSKPRPIASAPVAVKPPAPAKPPGPAAGTLTAAAKPPAAGVVPAVAKAVEPASAAHVEERVEEKDPEPTRVAKSQAKDRRERRRERTRRASARAASSKAPGKVSVRVNPWAEVFLDGKSLGITPMPPLTVPAGRQTFTLKNKEIGVTKKVTVNVPSGGQTVLKADLFE